jgi:hypothetical protein
MTKKKTEHLYRVRFPQSLVNQGLDEEYYRYGVSPEQVINRLLYGEGKRYLRDKVNDELSANNVRIDVFDKFEFKIPRYMQDMGLPEELASWGFSPRGAIHYMFSHYDILKDKGYLKKHVLGGMGDIYICINGEPLVETDSRDDRMDHEEHFPPYLIKEVMQRLGIEFESVTPDFVTITTSSTSDNGDNGKHNPDPPSTAPNDCKGDTPGDNEDRDAAHLLSTHKDITRIQRKLFDLPPRFDLY